MTQLMTLQQHSRNVERSLEQIPLGRLGHGSVTMQIAIPFAILPVGEVAVGIVAHHPMAFDVLLITRCQIGIETADDGFRLWPPELHVL